MNKKTSIYFLYIFFIFKNECMEQKINAASKVEKTDPLKKNSMWQSLKAAICDKTKTEQENLEFFKEILSLRMDLLDTQDKFGMTMLMYACSEKKPKFVAHLISVNAKLDLTNEFSETPTALAISKNNGQEVDLQIADMLVKAGATN